MALWQHYHQPQTVEAALSFLRHYNGRSRIMGGGTDLLLELQQGHKLPVEALVDVTSIPELNEIQQNGDWIEVGAAVTHTQIVNSTLITQQATCLVESCGVIGGPQVRNVATLGGNVAHALPAADGTTALVVLDAEAEVASENGRSWFPILSLFKGAGKSAVDQSRELITRFRFPALPPSSGTAFKRIMRPQGVALPILGCAVWVKVWRRRAEEQKGRGAGEQGRIEAVRICMGPVKPVPCRAETAEKTLIGRTLDEALGDCIAAAQAELKPRTSKHRATAEYRHEMTAVLLRRSLPLAVHRALTGEIIPEGIGLQ